MIPRHPRRLPGRQTKALGRKLDDALEGVAGKAPPGRPPFRPGPHRQEMGSWDTLGKKTTMIGGDDDLQFAVRGNGARQFPNLLRDGLQPAVYLAQRGFAGLVAMIEGIRVFVAPDQDLAGPAPPRRASSCRAGGPRRNGHAGLAAASRLR